MDPYAAAVRPTDRPGGRAFFKGEETEAHPSCVVMEPFPVREIAACSAQ